MADDIPADAIENAHVEVIQYLAPDGAMRYTTRYRGDVPLSMFVGLLELAKLDIIREAREW